MKLTPKQKELIKELTKHHGATTEFFHGDNGPCSYIKICDREITFKYRTMKALLDKKIVKKVKAKNRYKYHSLYIWVLNQNHCLFN